MLFRSEDVAAKKTGLEAVKATKDRVETIVNTIKDQEVYNVAVGKSELANLLSFQGEEDHEYVERGERRGGRGGRGAARGGRGPRIGGGDHDRRGGRKQEFRADDFPSLE